MPKTVLTITKSYLGNVEAKDAKFGSEMLNKFLHTVDSQDEKPLGICFYTEGVKNVLEGSPLLPILQQLEQHDVKMVVCKTCLVYYSLESQVALGRVSGMDEIVGLINQADKVISV